MSGASSSAERSGTSTLVGRSDFWRSGPGPPRLDRFPGTREMVISTRTALDECGASTGEFVVLTAVHIVRAYSESARCHVGYRVNVIKVRGDIEPHKYDRRSGCTGSKRPLQRACAARTHIRTHISR